MNIYIYIYTYIPFKVVPNTSRNQFSLKYILLKLIDLINEISIINTNIQLCSKKTNIIHDMYFLPSQKQVLDLMNYRKH